MPKRPRRSGPKRKSKDADPPEVKPGDDAFPYLSPALARILYPDLYPDFATDYATDYATPPKPNIDLAAPFGKPNVWDQFGSWKTNAAQVDQQLRERREEATRATFEQLDALIGLEPVKNQIRAFSDLVELQKERVEAGLKRTNLSYHLVFTGNPGTGKTTVARIVGQIFKELAVLKKGHVVETDRAGLIGQYIGHTAKIMQEVVASAMHGLLFIDEAYTLTPKDNEKDYGHEAVATLLTLMENHRDKLVVIIAGYPDHMRRFINSNPGLRSRFKTFVDFPDYNADELFDIFVTICEDQNNLLEPDAEDKLALTIDQLLNQHEQHFGNGRAMRNLYEECLARQATRLAGHTGKPSPEDLIILKTEDIPDPQDN